jgi:hypothetical protein
MISSDRVLKTILLVAAGLILVGAAVAVQQIGLRNIVGMLRYDQRREGALKVGDKAPDVVLRGLDGTGEVRLLDGLRGRPLVLIFGSYT